MSAPMPRLVGITGLAGCGKDTLAAHLAAEHGFHVYRLAQPLKQALNGLFGWTDEQWEDREWKESGFVVIAADSEDVDHGYSPRRLAQWLGTEVGRTLGGEDVWVNLMHREWNRLADEDMAHGTPARMVVPDVRFDNEARRIRALGGVVVRVWRAGLTKVNQHVSENGVSDSLVDLTIVNDCDLDVFKKRGEFALRRLAEAA